MIEKLLGLPINASAHGGEIDVLMLAVHLLMVILFVGWMGFFLYTVFRFRRSRNPVADYRGVKSHASSYLEVAVVIAELALLAGLSIPLWAKKVNAFPSPEDSVRVRVVAQQYAWNVHYPGPDGIYGRTDIKLVNEQTNPIGLDRDDPHGKDDITTINQLHLPVGKPAIIELSTKDVIHSFFLPHFRVKQDTIPGMTIPVDFTPTQTTDDIREELAKTVQLPTRRTLKLHVAMQDYKNEEGKVILKKGRSVSDSAVKKLLENGITEITIAPRTPTEIACAQLCGLGHYRMRGFMTVEAQQSFDEWIEEELEYLEE